MPLHMTKVAYGAQSLAEIHQWFSAEGHRGGAKLAYLTTRNRPRRADEMIGGSLYWILKHQLVARSEIVGFEDAGGGRTNIVVSTMLVDVHPRPRRAHQGWRYLEPADAPADLAEGETGEVLPAQIAAELSKLGLV